MTAAVRDLYSTMDKGTTVPPIILLQVLHTAFPRFAERGEGGGYQQQDANECWMEVLRMLQNKTTPTETSIKANAVEQFMGIECSSETKCVEVNTVIFHQVGSNWKIRNILFQAEGEEATKSTEKFIQFSCYIDKDVKYLHTGLKNRLSK